MKHVLVSLVIALSAAVATAGEPILLPETPLLVKEIGKIAHNGKTSVCEVYASHPKISGRVEDIKSLISAAKTKGELEVVALFVHAQIPTEVIVANIENIGPMALIERVELEVVYSDISARTSAEAQELIALTNEICN